ncbi:hypothetical protein HNY73_012349 [Argiope bruennichi]|uniref:Uncharacterized protein n=1 Tax=Argiope bruennichi TaxID=94029 RepID=A0A8T0EWC2_ARGBR|nr:hypothetical protein HNY73_012349 [Argiope bruennichi]
MIPRSQPTFPNRFRRPFMPAPQCPKCQSERNGNYDSHSREEICDYCNKTISYQAYRVCDCGCRPVVPGQPIPAYISRMMGFGDQDFSMSNTKPGKVKGSPETLFFETYHDED